MGNSRVAEGKATPTMGKKGKKAQAGKPKKLKPKDVSKRLDVLAKKVEEELEGADLFAPLPPTEDCAICFIPLPRTAINSFYNTCCGKVFCKACLEAGKIIKKKQEKNGKNACPFCRQGYPTTTEMALHRLEARAAQNDHEAWYCLGDTYKDAKHGVSKDELRALDCFIRAVDLGSAKAANVIGEYYRKGTTIARDVEKECLFYRMGALRGYFSARYNIGCSEYNSGNHEIGIRHWKIAAEAGMQASIDTLKKIYNANGKIPGKEFISQECMGSLYRACHDAQEEVKSEEREKHFHQVDEFKC